MRTITAVVITTLLGCGTPSTEPANLPSGSESRVETDTGVPFTLAPGERATIPDAGLEVRFLEVATDGRCPTDVTCVWEGDAEVVVETVRGGVERAWVLHTAGPPTSSRRADLGEYILELVELEPTPRSDEAIPQADYRATLRVDRDG